MPAAVIDASAGGAFLSQTGVTQVLRGVRLRAGADAATATVRETDGSGRILAVLGAAAGLADEQDIPVTFLGNVHVTTTGTSPKVLLFQ